MIAERKTPTGWTAQGMPAGWLRPTPNPYQSKINKLEEQNEQLMNIVRKLAQEVEELKRQ